jgi:hypothetical protein
MWSSYTASRGCQSHASHKDGALPHTDGASPHTATDRTPHHPHRIILLPVSPPCHPQMIIHYRARQTARYYGQDCMSSSTLAQRAAKLTALPHRSHSCILQHPWVLPQTAASQCVRVGCCQQIGSWWVYQSLIMASHVNTIYAKHDQQTNLSNLCACNHQAQMPG